MGNGEWGIGNREWGMGNGEWGKTKLTGDVIESIFQNNQMC